MSDRDQTASDQDQTWSDHDQTASERDQRSADEDQLAADDDFAAGGDATAHNRSALARERSGRDRDAVSGARAESAVARLGTAADRDRAAELRDRGAEGRDALARLHDLQDDAEASREDILLRAERDRARAAADRAKAADDRARAAADREEAARERDEALRERTKSADNLRLATTDELTGAWTRKFGLEEVSRELERAHRTGARLVLAFVDVDGLKAVNDSRGHLAGDALLRLVAETLRANVRPYDVIVRYGGRRAALRDAEPQCARGQGPLREDRHSTGGGRRRPLGHVRSCVGRARRQPPRTDLPRRRRSSRSAPLTCKQRLTLSRARPPSQGGNQRRRYFISGLGYTRAASMLERKTGDPVLEALLRKRVQVYTWLEGPVKQANLAAINHMIEQHRERARARAA